MREIHYHLYSGKTPKSCKSFIYAYAKTNNIQLRVHNKGFSVEYVQKVKKDPYILLNKDRLVRDAIKKATKIQLIIFGRFYIDDIYVEIDGNIFCIFRRNYGPEKLIYCMCERGINKLPKHWSDNCLQRVLSSTKTNADRLDSALDSLLIAKSKQYEVERFIYLWMAMNGLYGYTSAVACDSMISDKERKWIDKEFGKIKFFSIVSGIAYCNNNNDDLLHMLEWTIAKVKTDDNEMLLNAIKNNDIENDCVRKIVAVIKDAGIEEELHPYAVLLLYMPYKMRCKYFHAEWAVPLTCFENEHPLTVLKILNMVMEDYLDENLYKWFDSEYLKKFLVPRIKLCAQKCRCSNSGRLLSYE